MTTLEQWTGELVSITERIRSGGDSYFTGRMKLADGGLLDLVCWFPISHIKEGMTVDVQGIRKQYRGQDQLEVRTLRRHFNSDEMGPIQRYLYYLYNCLLEEGVSDIEHRLNDDHQKHLLIESGAFPRFKPNEQCPIRLSKKNIGWCRQEHQGSDNGRIWLGWPLVLNRYGNDLTYTPLVSFGVQVQNDLTLRWRDDAPVLSSRAMMLLGLDEFGADDVHQLSKDAIKKDPSLIQLFEVLGERGVEDLPQDNLFRGILQQKTIANAALLFRGEASNINRLVLHDLEHLIATDEEALCSSPVGALLGYRKSKEFHDWACPVLTVPLNFQQEKAVIGTQKNEITTVTGPPGTGKSQVLLAASTAAVCRGERVVISSKNNKAVDVVIERLKKLHPVIDPLRVGASFYMDSLEYTFDNSRSRFEPVPDQNILLNDLTAIQKDAYDVLSIPEQRIQIQSKIKSIQAEMAVLEIPKDGPSWTNEDIEAFKFQIHAMDSAVDRYRTFRSSWWPCIFLKSSAQKRLAQSEGMALAGFSRDFHSLIPPIMDWKVLPWMERVEQLQHYVRLRGQLNKERQKLTDFPGQSAQEELLDTFVDNRAQIGLLHFINQWRSSGEERKHHEIQTSLGFIQRSNNGVQDNFASMQEVENLHQRFPIWGVTNQSARRVLPLVKGSIDLLIIDEASQCDIATALPLIYRAQKLMVVGDPKQLQHINRLNTEAEQAIANDSQWSFEPSKAYSQNSLFDMASKTKGQGIFLSKHYRSEPQLIDVSNQLFYDSKLIPMRERSQSPTIHWDDIEGRFERLNGRSAWNEAEVERIAHILVMRLSSWTARGWNVGVVTPFRAQADMIKAWLEDFQVPVPDSLIVDTAHQFQGDERDLMIFSPVVSAKMPDGLFRFAEQSHLLNVALSRARERLLIVGDKRACQRGGVYKKLVEICEKAEFHEANNE